MTEDDINRRKLLKGTGAGLIGATAIPHPVFAQNGSDISKPPTLEPTLETIPDGLPIGPVYYSAGTWIDANFQIPNEDISEIINVSNPSWTKIVDITNFEGITPRIYIQVEPSEIGSLSDEITVETDIGTASIPISVTNRESPEPTSRVLFLSTPFNRNSSAGTGSYDNFRKFISDNNIDASYTDSIINSPVEGLGTFDSIVLSETVLNFIDNSEIDSLKTAFFEGVGPNFDQLIIRADPFYGDTVKKANKVVDEFGGNMQWIDKEIGDEVIVSQEDIRNHEFAEGVESLRFFRPGRIEEAENDIATNPEGPGSIVAEETFEEGSKIIGIANSGLASELSDGTLGSEGHDNNVLYSNILTDSSEGGGEEVNPTVEDTDGNPVPNATVRLFGKGVYTDEKSEGRIIAEQQTDPNGSFDLPMDFEEGDEELVLTANKGDWFSTQEFDVDEISSPEDYGTLVLDRQLLSGPSVARAENGDAFGTVTVWRHIFDDQTDIFYTELTNNYAGQEREWLIVEAEGAYNGPGGGNFLFTYPESKASVVEDTGYAESDPTGDGGVQVFATHRPSLGYCCNEPFKLRDPLVPSAAGFLHPMRNHSGLPLYETTKRLGEFAEPPNPTSVQAEGWHPLTPESTERADDIESRLEKGIEFPAAACDFFGGSCGFDFLLDALDGLNWVNKILDGGARTATINENPNTPIAGGETPSGEFDVWQSDMAAPFDEAHEASVVHQVPIQERDDEVTYSVQAEWARPYNNRGQFSTTFTTGPIDIEIVAPQSQPQTTIESNDVRAEDNNSIDVRVKNRSLSSRKIVDVVVEYDNKRNELNPNLRLAAGEATIISEVITLDSLEDVTVQAKATDDQGKTVTRTNTYSSNRSSGGNGGDENDSALNEYRNENGVVDTSGLQEAINDFVQGDLGTGDLQEVINAFVQG